MFHAWKTIAESNLPYTTVSLVGLFMHNNLCIQVLHVARSKQHGLPSLLNMAHTMRHNTWKCNSGKKCCSIYPTVHRVYYLWSYLTWHCPTYYYYYYQLLPVRHWRALLVVIVIHFTCLPVRHWKVYTKSIACGSFILLNTIIFS